MSTTTTNEIPETAAAAVEEATRIAAQAARRSTETARASVDVARNYLDETTALGRGLMESWYLQGEAALKASFEAQNAAMGAGMGYFDLGIKGNRQALEQLTELMQRTQKATIESWQATVKAATKTADATKR